MKKFFITTTLVLLAALFASDAEAENYPYRSDYLWITVPDHSDWIYKTGEKATIEVEFYKYGIPRDGEVNYEIARDMLDSYQKGKAQLKNGRCKINIGTSKTPGFVDLRLSTTVDGVKYNHHCKVGFSPEKIQPYTKMPSDFDAFWQQNLDEMRKQPLEYSMEKSEKYTTDKIDAYLVKLKVDRRGHCIYGYLTRPKAAGKYPVVMCPPGAGVKTIKEPLRHKYYAENGFIRFEIEIHGLNPEMSQADFADASRAFGDYLQFGLSDKDSYYMKHVYQACVRSIDFLTSLDEWDGKNVAVQGGSQGGALSLVTAGLDKRVTQAVANHPALSDMAGYKDGGTGGYPHFNKTPGMLSDANVKTMQYYDVVNFARRISCPTYITWGYNDNVCPPTTSYAVYNVITAPKEALITPINEHWTSDATEYGQMVWIKNHLK